MGKAVFLKGMIGGRLKALSMASDESKVIKIVESLERTGCTVHVITEFEFWELHSQCTVDKAELVTNKPVSPEQAAEIVGRYL